MIGDLFSKLQEARQKIEEAKKKLNSIIIETASENGEVKIKANANKTITSVDISEAFKSSKEKIIKSYALGVRYLIIIMLPIAIGVTLLSDGLILLIYGHEFTGSTTALQILIWSILLGGINLVFLNLLVSIDRQKLNTLSVGICAIVNIFLNLILIPVLSYNGAAIATIMTNVVLFIVAFYFVSKYLQVLPLHKILIKPAIGALIMGAFVYYFIDVNIFLLVPLAGVVYLVILIALKTFTGEDWDIVKKIVRRT